MYENAGTVGAAGIPQTSHLPSQKTPLPSPSPLPPPLLPLPTPTRERIVIYAVIPGLQLLPADELRRKSKQHSMD